MAHLKLRSKTSYITSVNSSMVICPSPFLSQRAITSFQQSSYALFSLLFCSSILFWKTLFISSMSILPSPFLSKSLKTCSILVWFIMVARSCAAVWNSSKLTSLLWSTSIALKNSTQLVSWPAKAPITSVMPFYSSCRLRVPLLSLSMSLNILSKLVSSCCVVISPEISDMIPAWKASIWRNWVRLLANLTLFSWLSCGSSHLFIHLC